MKSHYNRQGVYFAVSEGHRTGILFSREDLEKSIKDYPHPKYFVCKSYSEAIEKLAVGFKMRLDKIVEFANKLDAGPTKSGKVFR